MSVIGIYHQVLMHSSIRCGPSGAAGLQREVSTLVQMDCPNCKLVNPPNATRCDCGYDFQTRTIQQSYLTERDKRLLQRSGGVAGIVCAVLLTLEFALKLTSAAVARHSVAIGVFTVLLIAASLGFWLWLFNGKVWRGR